MCLFRCWCFKQNMLMFLIGLVFRLDSHNVSNTQSFCASYNLLQPKSLAGGLCEGTQCQPSLENCAALVTGVSIHSTVYIH